MQCFSWLTINCVKLPLFFEIFCHYCICLIWYVETFTVTSCSYYSSKVFWSVCSQFYYSVVIIKQANIGYVNVTVFQSKDGKVCKRWQCLLCLYIPTTHYSAHVNTLLRGIQRQKTLSCAINYFKLNSSTLAFNHMLTHSQLSIQIT